MTEYVSELNVLIATCRWLHQNGWQIDSVSPATGYGLPAIAQQKDEVRSAFNGAHIPFQDRTLFRPKGPDSLARSGRGIWKFECKGIAPAEPQTHRNNFDRALASVVSYFDAPQLRIGLALAGDYLWEYRFGERLPQSLREAIGLWLFLMEKDTACAFEPTEDLPYPGAND